MPKVNVHEIWRFKSKVDKETGEIKHGLFNLIGQAGAAIELRKRCELELDAGEPLAGCTHYIQLIKGWAVLCIKDDDAYDAQVREYAYKLLLAAGERELVEYIEEVWRDHGELTPLPPDKQYEAIAEITEILADKHGEDIATDISHLTAREIVLSKTLALSLGRRKRRTRPPSPSPAVEEPEPEYPEEPEPEYPEEPEPEYPEEPEPEPPGETIAMTEATMRDAFKAKMKRA